MDICEGICAPFRHDTDTATKEKICWEFLTAPKRFLYLPKKKVSSRGMHRIMLDRVGGNFDEAGEFGEDITTQEERDIARVERLFNGGAMSRAARALEQKSLPPHSPEVQAKLAKDLHPPSSQRLPVNPDNGARYASLDTLQLTQIFRELPRMATPNGDGWTRELAMPLLRIPSCREVMSFIILSTLNGTLTHDLADMLRDSNFVLLTKESAEDEPAGRPIAMPSLFAKLAALISFERTKGNMLKIFGDMQFGALRRQGAETIIIQSREAFRGDRTKVLVTIDLRNAFNSIQRSKVLEAVHHYQLEDLYNLTHVMYGTPSRLLSPIIQGLMSSNGVRQGDPLGPVLFCLGIHPTLTALSAAHPNVKIWAYIDDITLHGTPDEVASFVADLETRLAALGLQVRRDKSWVLAHSRDQFEAFRSFGLKYSMEGIRVLGAWIAADDSTESDWVLTRVPKIDHFFDRLTKVDRQVAQNLFRWCGIPRWTHLVRTHHPEATKAASAEVDKSARRCVTKLFGGDSDVEAYLFNNKIFTGCLTSVPFVELAPMAYGACVDGVNNLPRAKSQKERTAEYYKAVIAEWKSSPDATVARKKVLVSCLISSSRSAWVNCRPNRPEYKMRQCEVETALRLRYLVPPTNDPAITCTCAQSFAPQDFVVHALDCNRVTGYTWASRHAHVKEVFKKVLTQYGFRPDRREPRFLPGGRGPDVLFQMGDTLALVDIVICNPLADTYVEAEAATPGQTLKKWEAEKARRYGADILARGMEFYPLALTTYGTPGQKTLAFLKKVSRYTENPTGFMRHILTALDVAVQIGNAKIVMAATSGWWENGVR